MQEKTTITFTGPESLRQIMKAKGNGYGVLNTDRNKALINGSYYPKGTVFHVWNGMVWAEGEPDMSVITPFLIGQGFEQISNRQFRRGDVDVDLRPEQMILRIFGPGNNTRIYCEIFKIDIE